MNKELKYEDNKKWQAFRKCLTGSRLTQWDNMANTFYEEENSRKTDAFKEALNKWLDAICACKNARDCQYRHMSDRFQCYKELRFDVTCIVTAGKNY